MLKEHVSHCDNTILICTGGIHEEEEQRRRQEEDENNEKRRKTKEERRGLVPYDIWLRCNYLGNDNGKKQ